MARKNRRLRQQQQRAASSVSDIQAQANQQAFHSIDRSEHRGLRSVRSMSSALDDSITAARREVKGNEHLLPEDRAQTLAGLSAQRLSAAAAAPFLATQVRQDAAAERADVRQQILQQAADAAAAEQSATADALAAAQDRRSDRRETKADRRFTARQNALDRKDAAKPSASDKAAERESRKSAEQAAKAALVKLSIEQKAIPGSSSDWALVEDAVSGAGSVNAKDAEKAVNKLHQASVILLARGMKPQDVLDRLTR